MVFVKGFNVFPREVEEVIHALPKVGGVGVIGVPDARTGGERLVAFVVPCTGKIVDPAEISAQLRVTAGQLPVPDRALSS